MKYIFMISVALILAIFSSLLTALGMIELFSAAGMFLLVLFIVIDLGRFLLFNFVVDEWHNLRKVKYVVSFILILLFFYSALGVYSKMSSLIPQEVYQAMVNTATYNKAADNAQVKQSRSEDLAKIAQDEYKETLQWNKEDHSNCILRAQSNSNILIAENKCNNTKRSLDIKASITLKEMLANADKALSSVEETTTLNSQNKSEIASVLTTICKFTQKTCDTYDNLQNALTIVIILVIVGVDYLQIAIILAVNTRKNKPTVKIGHTDTKITVPDISNVIERVDAKDTPITFTDKIDNDIKNTFFGNFGPKPRNMPEVKKPNAFSPESDFLDKK